MNQKQLLEKAFKYFPGGTVGAFYLPPEMSFVITRGQGSRFWDADGKEYIDFLLGSGPMILGHSHPAVVEAVEKRIRMGTSFFTLNDAIIELAEQVVEASPCGEKIRFVTTGSEAVMYSVRMARAYTGRPKMLRFEGGWHGVADTVLYGARPPKVSAYPRPTPDTAGIVECEVEEVLVSPFNDGPAAAKLIADYHDSLGCVLIEPLQRCIKPRPGFFETIREACTKYGVVMIFDEVVTGFRLAWGGAQERYGVIPDVAVYGKTISGGYPNAAICGKAEVLDTANPRGGNYPLSPKAVIASGTFNGNPVSAVAGLATLKELRKPGTYERFYALFDRIAREIEALGREFSIPVKVGGDGPVLQVLFTKDEIKDYTSMLYADKKRAYTYGIEMIRRGCFVSPFEKIYLSTAHSDADIDRLLETSRDVFKNCLPQIPAATAAVGR